MTSTAGKPLNIEKERRLKAAIISGSAPSLFAQASRGAASIGRIRKRKIEIDAILQDPLRMLTAPARELIATAHYLESSLQSQLKEVASVATEMASRAPLVIDDDTREAKAIRQVKQQFFLEIRRNLRAKAEDRGLLPRSPWRRPAEHLDLSKRTQSPAIDFLDGGLLVPDWEDEVPWGAWEWGVL